VELISVYQQGNSAYASLRDGKQLAEVTVGDTFSGYEVIKIDLQNNQVTLKKGGQIVVIKNYSSTK
jgi:archaellum component FlaG (FlaF/FlaG flagellin family)